ncbi:MAG: AraC family transcriptional regulator, partial [Pseudomonadota bacterium]
MSSPAGGGPFALPKLTIGVFLVPQPTHRWTIGGDRLRAIPLDRDQGWIHPAGAEGVCAFDDPLDFVAVSFDAAILEDAGLADPRAAQPVVGALDPLLTQMALQAEAFGSHGALYRETMERAMAAQLARMLGPVRAETVAIDDRRLLRAIDWIHDHLAEDISLAAMADVAAMSAPHFAR